MTKAPVKHDQGKSRVELLSGPALLGMGDVLAFGATVYEDHGWRKGRGFKWSRISGAAMRHLIAFNSGEDLDPESGLPHIDHAACCVQFLSEYQKLGTGIDDRFKIKARKVKKTKKRKARRKT